MRIATIWFGVLSTAVLVACGGGSPSDDFPKEPTEATLEIAPRDIVATDAEAARFLIQSTYGPNDAAIAQLRQVGYGNWLALQFNTPSLDSH